VAPRAVIAFAPGRVNLLGDHTDYTGGRCFPIAIDRGVELRGDRVGAVVRLTSDAEPGEAVAPLDAADGNAIADVQPPWARYVAAVVRRVHPRVGMVGTIRSTLPIGVGLSSSAALEVAVALAVGADPSDPIGLARLCQAAEHDARGVPTGILDQLTSICGVEGHGLLLDCHDLTVQPVPLPPDAEWVVIAPPRGRALEQSGYAQRVRELAVAEQQIGPLRLADLDAVDVISDEQIRRRARHVVTENDRVVAFAAAAAAGDLVAAGRLMVESHTSLSQDFESSTAPIDMLCARLGRAPGVFGARITGGGWGGSVVVLARPGALRDEPGGMVVRASAGASLRTG
jgi:galactokinase